METKIFIWILISGLFFQIGFSINCGQTITTNVILNESLNCNSDGITLTSGSLNCDGFSIIGNKSGTGVLISSGDYIGVKNCNIKNFDNAISISSLTKWVGNGWGGGNYITYYPEYSLIENNNIKNNQIGIVTSNSIGESIKNNIFENNSNYALYLTSINGRIWNNTFYDSGIYYTKTGNNRYCENGLGNFYFDGAMGPACNCELLFDNLLVDSYVKICPKSYNISNPIKLKNANIDCSFSKLVGNNSINNGFEIIATENNIVKNCIFKNFNTAISISSETKWVGNGWGGGNYITTYPRNNFFENNEFNNNINGIVISNSYSDIIVNNSFYNNSVNSIALNSFSSDLGGNVFFDKEPSFVTTSGKSFCYNNISNIYLGEIVDHKCDCIVATENMQINSNVKLCKQKYNLSSGLILLNGGILDCNGAVLYGPGIGTGINFYGAVNSLVKNCNIENYETGVYFSTKYEKIGYNNFVYTSNNNKLENLKITNVDYGIYMQDNSRSEYIVNSSIVARNFSIYNNDEYFINARNNFWGTINETEIENKFLNKENISYIPYINDTIIDFEITETNIKFSKEHSKNYIYLNIKKTGYFDFSTEILLYKVKNGTIISNFTYENIILNGKEIKLELNFTLEENDEIIFIINPYNNILEIDKTNNFAKKSFPKIFKYAIFVNTNTKVADEEIKNYLKEILGNYNYVQTQDEADIIINITTKTHDKFNLSKDSFYFKKKPYESKIKIKENNSIKTINIVGEDLDGALTGVDKFSKEKEFFLINKYSIEINSTNTKGIEIYDYLHKNENILYYKTETEKFRNIIHEILYNSKYDFKEYNISIDYENGQLNYTLYELKPKTSEKYKNFVDNDKFPIIFAGGLFSNISTWEKMAKTLADKGFSVYMIELTGNTNNECETCYNYDYNFLTDKVYPTYIETILNISNSTKVKYVGHSNGARVAVDSINKSQINQDKFDTIILVGIPGAFDENSIFKNTIFLVDEFTQNSLENKTHISTKDFFFFRNDKNQNGKISSNLWLKYREWILGSEDSAPGKNINVESLLIIAGNFTYDGDGVIAVKDIENIYTNIESENKKMIITKDIHIGMSESKKIQEEIEKKLIEN